MKNKILKKICGLFGYKLISKNHFKNNRTLSQNSLLNINNLLKEIFESKKIKEIIQIGANDGSSFDELNYFIKKYKIKSLLIEPIKENFNKLRENYKNLDFITLENSAISINNEISHLYRVNPLYEKKYGSHIPAIPSFDKKHLINHGVKNRHIIQEKINSITIKDLIEKHNIKNIDLLFIDAEGYDGKIVYDFFLNSKIRPIIIFEYIHVENNFFKDLISELRSKDYLFFPVNENIYCYPKEKSNFKVN
jgi:FkbM family methyltransferase